MLAAGLVLSCTAKAQRDGGSIHRLSGNPGEGAAVAMEGVPKWATLDVQLRGRLEGQSSYDFVSGDGKAYLLTRDYVGLEVRPAKFLTGVYPIRSTRMRWGFR